MTSADSKLYGIVFFLCLYIPVLLACLAVVVEWIGRTWKRKGDAK